VWVYGSRVKGNARPDSDLDVAVELDIIISNERTLFWFDHGSTWANDLEALLPYPIDLELYEPDAKHVQKGVAEANCLCYVASE
jgi:predicted nucleotidyltransferase